MHSTCQAHNKHWIKNFGWQRGTGRQAGKRKRQQGGRQNFYNGQICLALIHNPQETMDLIRYQINDYVMFYGTTDPGKGGDYPGGPKSRGLSQMVAEKIAEKFKAWEGLFAPFLALKWRGHLWRMQEWSRENESSSCWQPAKKWWSQSSNHRN